MEFEIFIEEKAAFFVRYVRASQSERNGGRQGSPPTFVFFVEELGFTFCESTSDDELVCELGVRFADCGNGDVIAGREGINGGRCDAGRDKTTNMHSLAPFTESFLRR